MEEFPIEVAVSEKNLWAKERRVIPDQKASLWKSSWMESAGHGRDIHSFYIFKDLKFIYTHFAQQCKLCVEYAHDSHSAYEETEALGQSICLKS